MFSQLAVSAFRFSKFALPFARPRTSGLPSEDSFFVAVPTGLICNLRADPVDTLPDRAGVALVATKQKAGKILVGLIHLERKGSGRERRD